MTEPDRSDLRCDRVQLLLSLAIDGRTTDAQDAEIEAHVPGCAACRAAREADHAVRARCATAAVVPAGFGDRIVAAVSRQRLEARAQNRFLVAAAVAAVLVAAVSAVAFDAPRAGDAPGAQSAAVRDSAGRALRAGLAVDRTPVSGKEDR